MAKGLGLSSSSRTPARERYEDGWYQGRAARANGKPLNDVLPKASGEERAHELDNEGSLARYFAPALETMPTMPTMPLVDRSFIPACTAGEVEHEVRQPTEFELRMTAAMAGRGV